MKITYALSIAVMAALVTACGSPTTETTGTEGEGQDSLALNGTYTVDAASSTVNWEGSMLEVGGISLYSHTGNIAVSKGELMADNGQLVSGTILIDMTTIQPTDSNFGDAEGSRQSDLVAHLTSGDFFAVDSFATSTFEIIQAADGTVEGHLTLRGNKKPVIVEGVEMTTDENGVLNAKGTTTINRQDFGARFAMPVQEKVLSDNIKISFDIKATKVQDAA